MIDEASRMKLALMFTLAGLLVEAYCLYDLTPGKFVAMAIVAAPLVGFGLLIFVYTVWQVLRQTKGL